MSDLLPSSEQSETLPPDQSRWRRILVGVLQVLVPVNPGALGQRPFTLFDMLRPLSVPIGGAGGFLVGHLYGLGYGLLGGAIGAVLWFPVFIMLCMCLLGAAHLSDWLDKRRSASE